MSANQPLEGQTPRHGFSFAKIHFSIQYSKEKFKKYFTPNKHRHPNSGHALLQYEFLNNQSAILHLQLSTHYRL